MDVYAAFGQHGGSGDGGIGGHRWKREEEEEDRVSGCGMSAVDVCGTQWLGRGRGRGRKVRMGDEKPTERSWVFCPL